MHSKQKKKQEKKIESAQGCFTMRCFLQIWGEITVSLTNANQIITSFSTSPPPSGAGI
jgi:hypothetical protein